MLTDSELRSKVDRLWDKLWTGGLTNPMDAIEQFSYLLFMKRLDEQEDRRQDQARRQGKEFVPRLTSEQRWNYWTQLKAENALKHVKSVVFPALKFLGTGNLSLISVPKVDQIPTSGKDLVIVARLGDAFHVRIFDRAGKQVVDHPEYVPEKELGQRMEEAFKRDSLDLQAKSELIDQIAATVGYILQESSFVAYMRNAEFKINKPALLIEACKEIDGMQISAQNQDVQGDLYEYLLSKLSIAGRNGQFRTPRHIIRMMVQMMDPKPMEKICDPAAGTCGFLVNAYQYLLEQRTSPNILVYDEAGWPHHLIGDLLNQKEGEFIQRHALTGFDNDSGMSMLRIGSMNLMLNGIESPRFFYTDSLSKGFEEEASYDVILANPPFKGAIDKNDVSEDFSQFGTKTELLFIHLFLRLLDMGGRCAAIVPDGVLFGSSKAHVATRKQLIEDNRLDGVVSMPSGVFKPYAGVSTAILIFTKGAKTDRVWFYDMEHDGFSLDDKRQSVAENDIPDILGCWRNRFKPDFLAQKQARIAELKSHLEPLKEKRLGLEAEIHRLTFEAAIAPESDDQAREVLETEQQHLTGLKEKIAPLQSELNRLNRQFWVTKEQVKANKYDLSASRYRQIEQDEVFYEVPKVTLERLLKLEHTMAMEVTELERLLEEHNLDVNS
jgi:type I restriction enzyme M protein